MDDDLLDVASRIWTGDAPLSAHDPFADAGRIAEVTPGVAWAPGFSNTTALRTDEGLVLVDTSSALTGAPVHDAIRGWSPSPVHTIVFTHGHVDHVAGVHRYEQDARDLGAAEVRVVAHENVPEHFSRYRRTRGYNEIVNRRQFGDDTLRWPTDFREPDECYRTEHILHVGGLRVELYHDRGETDDHTWVWVPERATLCTGDFFIWASPNCGNPQKAQRYAKEWADALRRMAGMDAELLLPGHGVPIVGSDRVERSLLDAATLLDALHDETLAMMNDGASLDDILHTVRAPADLLARPYLRPIYDEPEFVVRGVWRRYGGWWDGDASQLLPAAAAALADEIAALAGGASALADRARALAEAGDLRLAAHLAEWAARAAPDDPSVHATRADVYERRRVAASSVMAKGIFGWAARESRARVGDA